MHFFHFSLPLDSVAKIYKLNNGAIANDFREIIHAFRKGNELKVKSLFYEILSQLDECEKKNLENPMYAVLNYINKHICDSYIDLRELSAKFGFSQDYFRHKFSKEIGVAPKKYISALKIKLAKDLLLNSELAVNQVAYNIGFCDYNYFTRFFKKETGYAPLQFRKKFKNYF